MASPAPFVHWVYEQVRGQLNLDHVEGSKQYKSFLDSMDIETFPLSGARRVQSFHVMKYGYPMRLDGYAAAAFVVRIIAQGIELDEPTELKTYFAYAYWPRHPSGSVADQPEYICLSPTFKSRDGEYRQRFLWYKQFHEGYEANASILSNIEEYLLEAIQNDEVSIEPYIFSRNVRTREYVSQSIKANRLDLKALVAVLAVDFCRHRDDTLQIHTTPTYMTIFKFLYENCADIFGDWTVDEKCAVTVFETGKAGQPLRTQCGQKLIPLTAREVLQVNDINFAPWREIWINRKVTDLIINGIAPMFAIHNNWTYIDGVNSSFFENHVIHERYDLSKIAEQIDENLILTRKLTGNRDVDERMYRLDVLLYKNIEFTKGYVLLTDLAVCITDEYVGMALDSIPDLIRRSFNVSPAFLRIFSEPVMLTRYIFDLCYGAHILHTESYIHSDLHLRNITIHELDNQYVGKVVDGELNFTPRFQNPVIAYIAGSGGEIDTYIFPHDGWFASLIDFSRAIIGPKARQAIIAEFGESQAMGFYHDQVARILRMLRCYFPKYIEQHHDRLKTLLHSDFETMFYILSAVDFLAIGRNCGTLFREIAARQKEPPRAGEERVVEIAAEGIELADKIMQAGLEHIVVNLNALLFDTTGQKPDVTFIGETILRTVFDEYRYSSWIEGKIPTHVGFSLDQATLVAIYNCTAPLTYSADEYRSFPSWALFEKFKPFLGNIHILQATADRGERPFLESNGIRDYLAVLTEQIRKKNYNAPPTKSSWIEI